MRYQRDEWGRMLWFVVPPVEAPVTSGSLKHSEKYLSARDGRRAELAKKRLGEAQEADRRKKARLSTDGVDGLASSSTDDDDDRQQLRMLQERALSLLSGQIQEGTQVLLGKVAADV